MKRFAVVVLLCAFAFACPKQRADVKNMTDPAAAAAIAAQAEDRSLAELNKLERPDKDALKERTAVEKQRFRVTGKVTKVESEADGDMKLFLASEDGSSRLVAEVPETECVAPTIQPQLKKVKKALHGVKTGAKVTLEGVGYWGYVREGETATNGLQLHPVLSAKVLPSKQNPSAEKRSAERSQSRVSTNPIAPSTRPIMN
jgi:hypothetical protein